MGAASLQKLRQRYRLPLPQANDGESRGNRRSTYLRTQKTDRAQKKGAGSRSCPGRPSVTHWGLERIGTSGLPLMAVRASQAASSIRAALPGLRLSEELSSVLVVTSDLPSIMCSIRVTTRNRCCLHHVDRSAASHCHTFTRCGARINGAGCVFPPLGVLSYLQASRRGRATLRLSEQCRGSAAMADKSGSALSAHRHTSGWERWQ